MSATRTCDRVAPRLPITTGKWWLLFMAVPAGTALALFLWNLLKIEPDEALFNEAREFTEGMIQLAIVAMGVFGALAVAALSFWPWMPSSDEKDVAHGLPARMLFGTRLLALLRGLAVLASAVFVGVIWVGLGNIAMAGTVGELEADQDAIKTLIVLGHYGTGLIVALVVLLTARGFTARLKSAKLDEQVADYRERMGVARLWVTLARAGQLSDDGRAEDSLPGTSFLVGSLKWLMPEEGSPRETASFTIHSHGRFSPYRSEGSPLEISEPNQVRGFWRVGNLVCEALPPLSKEPEFSMTESLAKLDEDEDAEKYPGASHLRYFVESSQSAVRNRFLETVALLPGESLLEIGDFDTFTWGFGEKDVKYAASLLVTLGETCPLSLLIGLCRIPFSRLQELRSYPHAIRVLEELQQHSKEPEVRRAATYLRMMASKKHYLFCWLYGRNATAIGPLSPMAKPVSKD